MRKEFTNQLEGFYDQLIHMGNISHEAFRKAILSYNSMDKELAKEVVDNDININNLSVEIEGEAYRIIALQQPVTDDLRKVFAVLLASSDFERIADHAASIAKSVCRAKGDESKTNEEISLINEMADQVAEMLTELINELNEHSDEKVREIAKQDDEVDHLLKKLYKKTAKNMKQTPDVVDMGISHLKVGQSIERIGDYVTNICERLLYLSTGELPELNE